MARWVNRHIFVWAIVALMMYVCMDKPKAHDSRGRYLLGIFYNGHFENLKDGIVYLDYMHRIDPSNPDYTAKLKFCYEHLK